MDSLKVLLLPLKDLFHPWCDEVIAAVDKRHGLRVFDADDDLASQFAGIDVVIDHGGSVGTRAMMDAAVDARLWHILGTGFDHFDLDYIRAKGIPVANCPGQFSSIALAETAMMYILMLSHQYLPAAVNFYAGTLYQPMGRELGGTKLGIIGFGASGQELARRARGFGMRILAIDIQPIAEEILDELQPEFLGTPDDLEKVVAQSDYLSLHLHLNDQTRHLINTERLALMKKDACLINVARGALADEEALYKALIDGQLGGAGLDAFAQEPPDSTLPVYQLPNVVVTPHTAGVTDGTARRRAACASQNVERVAAGQEPLYRIDL
jgi:phosphoglycerate dehydrogenase-like enzyme